MFTVGSRPPPTKNGLLKKRSCGKRDPGLPPPTRQSSQTLAWLDALLGAPSRDAYRVTIQDTAAQNARFSRKFGNNICRYKSQKD